MRKNRYDGGLISNITNEYKENLIENKSVDSENCHLIKEIIPKQNEGRKNDGIGFVEIDGVEYFLKYQLNLIDEFRTGYYLSKLRDIYPYFLNVHTILNCEYKPRSSDTIKEGHILIVDKGTETVYQYLNRNTLEYFNKNIPEVQKKTLELDVEIEKIESDTTIIKDDKMKYIEKLIKNCYLDLSTEYIKFKTEFVNLFLHNYKIMLNLYFLLDVVVMSSYNHYFTDKKSDNYMVKSEKETDLNKTHIQFNVNFDGVSKSFKIDNTCIWGDIREHCYIYPVDFGSCSINVDYYDDLKDLQVIFLNQWIWSLMRMNLYSDVKHSPENGNFISIGGNPFRINFSKYYKNYKNIFDIYNPFSINIVNPLAIFSSSFERYIFTDTEKQTTKKMTDNNDHRFQFASTNKYNNINLLDAIQIIYIFFLGYTVRKDKDKDQYHSSSTGLSFYIVNGMMISPNEYNNDIHKTFTFRKPDGKFYKKRKSKKSSPKRKSFKRKKIPLNIKMPSMSRKYCLTTSANNNVVI